MKFNRNQRRLYELLKPQSNRHCQEANPIMFWSRLSVDSHLSLRHLRETLKTFKAFGLVNQQFHVPSELTGLKLAQVQIKPGKELLKEKEELRKQFFESKGSMRLPEQPPKFQLSLKPKFPAEWD